MSMNNYITFKQDLWKFVNNSATGKSLSAALDKDILPAIKAAIELPNPTPFMLLATYNSTAPAGKESLTTLYRKDDPTMSKCNGVLFIANPSSIGMWLASDTTPVVLKIQSDVELYYNLIGSIVPSDKDFGIADLGGTILETQDDPIIGQKIVKI